MRPVGRGGRPTPRTTGAALDLEIFPHRGDINPTDGWPENTIPAFTQAMARHLGYFEVDVRRSSEGTWWCIHDATVTRTTTSSGNVADKTDAQMAALVIDGGFGYRGQLGLGVPTLDAVFAATGTPIHAILDMKETTDAAHTALAQYVVAEGLEDYVHIGCTSLTGAAAVKVVSADVETSVQLSVSSDISANPNVDSLGVPNDQITAEIVATNAPKPVGVFNAEGSAGWLDDEKSQIQATIATGCTHYVTNDLTDALLYANPTYIYAA